MIMLSTGDPSTLRSYKKYAELCGDEAIAFIQNKINKSPNGEDEEVLANENQMIALLSSMMSENVKRRRYIEWKIKDGLKPTHAEEHMRNLMLKSQKTYQQSTHGK